MEASELFRESLPFLNQWGDRKRQLLGLVGVLGFLTEAQRWTEAHALLTSLEVLLPPFQHVFVPVHQRMYERYAHQDNIGELHGSVGPEWRGERDGG